MYRIVAQSFPNNEIRVTWSALPGIKKGKASTEVPLVVEVIPLVNLSLENSDSAPLSLAPNSKTKRSDAGYGSLPQKPTRFGLNAKRSLIRHGAAMVHHAPAEECLFLTGTLPGSTEGAYRAIAEWSSYIVHRLKAWIATYTPGKLDFYCWEYQKRGALHLHYCVWMPSNNGRNHILDGFHAWWVEILHRIGERSNTDLFRKNASKTHLGDTSKVRAVAEVCRKSPARYLAKYLSKSAEPRRGPARAFTPARFWGSSRPLKAACDALTTTAEIVMGGYHKVREVWEAVSHVCASSDSVTYAYRHRVGLGNTVVSYPNTPEEKTWLLESLRSLQSMRMVVSEECSQLPSQVLKTVKIQQMRLLEELLDILPKTQTGLRSLLENRLRWITTITPSSHQEPLSVCLAWMASTADIAYNLRFAPNIPYKTRQTFDDWLDTMDTQLNLIAENGWK